METKKVLTIQDISCYGGCSITVALPILSSFGIETSILPSAILSTHTGGFKGWTNLDLTLEMPKIVDHWIKEGIKFDAIYTGYIGDTRQFDTILKCKEKLLKENGLFIVDPAMADNGKLYPALNDDIVVGMKKIVAVADYILPNITEACYLTSNQYEATLTKDYVAKLLKDCYALGAKNVILTGVGYSNKELGASSYDGKVITTLMGEKINKMYHGTGDVFSSVAVACILNEQPLSEVIKTSISFTISAIKETLSDEDHFYGVKFEQTLKKRNF